MIVEKNWQNHMCQMHDERVSDILVQEDKVIFQFEELMHSGLEHKACDIIFQGFDDIYTDIEVFAYDIDSDLNVSGKLHYFDDFLNAYIIKGKPVMDITEILYGRNRIIIRGVLLIKSGYSQRHITIQIDAKEMLYRWL